MTREEAKEKLYMEWQKFLEDNIDYAGISEAYKMAVKALEEQEPTDKKFTKADIDAIVKAINTGWELRVNEILDKIRAEIEELPTKTRTNWDGCCPDIDYPEIEYVDVTKDKLLMILDKYKAEIEPQESEDKDDKT